VNVRLRKRVLCVYCVQKVASDVRPVWFVFAGMGTQWPRMGRDLMNLDCFRESIMRLDSVLKPFGVDLFHLLMYSEDDALNDIVSMFVGVVSIQVISHVSDFSKQLFVFCSSQKAVYHPLIRGFVNPTVIFML